MRKLDLVIGTSAVVFTCSFTANIAQVGQPGLYNLSRLGCILSAFVLVAAVSHRQFEAGARRAADDFKEAVDQAVHEQAQKLGAAIAEEMHEYGNARAIDAMISAEQRIAARHRAEDATVNLDDLRPPDPRPPDRRLARNERVRAIPLATVVQLRNRG